MIDDGSLLAVGWDTDPALDWQRFATLPGDLRTDACVVGLGGSGLAAIGELLGRGLDVVGIDAGRIAAGAAGRNGGFLLGGPAVAVHHLAASIGADAAVELYRQTLGEIDHLESLLGDDVIRRVGSIRIAGLPGPPPVDTLSSPTQAQQDSTQAQRYSTQAQQDSTQAQRYSTQAQQDPTQAQAQAAEAEEADCDEQFEFMRGHGLQVQRYSGSLGRGLYFPNDAAMNPVRRAMGLAAMYGGRARMFERTPATAITAGTVETARGTITADRIIVAIDGRLEVLLPQLAGRVRTARLQMLSTRYAPPGLLPCPIYANWGFDYLQQDAGGRLFAGGGRDRFIEDEWTTDTQPTAPVQRWIEGLLQRVVSAPKPPVTHRWAASVGYTPDGRPLVTRIADGVVACGGYSGTGNLIGPLAARAAVALALDDAPPPPWFAT